MRTSIPTVPGDSGSPVFHNYKVVGVMRAVRVWRTQPVFQISIAVPIISLRLWNEETKGALEFTWNGDNFPKMPFHRMNFKAEWEISRD
jgi:hypothetical protein